MFVFLLIFSIVLFLLNIYCFKNKLYPCLIIPCLLFLPEYYGFDISPDLPIITVSRIMLVVFYIYALINRKKNVSIKEWLTKPPFRTIFLVGYFIFRIISNIFYLSKYFQATKTILEILFEELCLIIAFFLLQPDRNEIIKIIKSIVFTASVLFWVGVFESYTYIRPFQALYTVNREMNNDFYVRLGLLRATTTMGLPVFYGNMCIMIFPLVLYLYNLKKNKLYLGIILVNFLATIHSGSRADIIFFFAITFVYLIYLYITKQKIIPALKNIAILSVLFLLLISFYSMLSPYAKYFYEGSAKAVLNEFGFEFDIDSSAPYGIDGFGDNKYGVSSRTFQLTGVKYAFSKNPIFGLGNGALKNGDVLYNGWGKWVPFYSFDMGIVQILISEGILGMLGYISLFIYLALLAYNQRSTQDKKLFIVMAIMPIAYLMSTLSTANMSNFLFCMVTQCVVFSLDSEKDNNSVHL
ncbi:O-antigen ligase family protein [Butyrivibrio sp. AE3006]|uniref:O-antigen ligase family protein n=1 Tax=Butyrivibrio sp. AE3006 TaxID=1280673 RepID=UPI000423985B|nr:O-antigen polymerase [Butyrivibrio sp. AE3006]